MNPVKCPNCRLSLPQNWAGMNDPNAKCPYCGKALAGQTAPASSPSPSPAAPAPQVSRPAKTMLWGVGVPLPGIMPKTVPAPAPQPAAGPAPTSTKDALASAATQNRHIAEPAFAAPSAPAQPAQGSPEGTDIDVDVEEPAMPVPASPMVPTPSKPSQAAATVMFESGGGMDMSPGKMERQAPEQAPSASETAEEMPESEPPANPGPRPTPSKSRFKSKPLPKKGKAKTSKPARWSGTEDDAEEPKPASSKTPIIIVAAVALIALIGAGVYFLRGKDASEPTAKEPAKAEPAPGDEPTALAAKPAPTEPTRPEPKVAPAEKPARAEKPTPAEKPAHTEKPAHAEKATADRPKVEPSGPEPKSGNGKPSEEDYKRANEAYERGNAKLFQGKTADAIAEYNQALKLNPKDPSIHRGLGLAYAQFGKAADATKHLKLYLKGSPKAPDRAIIEKRIDQLRGQ
jgi:hypothetical protein